MKALDKSMIEGYEGVMFKSLASHYLPGARDTRTVTPRHIVATQAAHTSCTSYGVSYARLLFTPSVHPFHSHPQARATTSGSS